MTNDVFLDGLPQLLLLRLRKYLTIQDKDNLTDDVFVFRGSPATTTTASSAPTWTSLGCYTDDSRSRALTSAYSSSSSQTVEKCQAWCRSKSTTYVYAGVETSDQ